MTTDLPDGSPKGGLGPMIFIVLACVLLCVGSIGGIGFFLVRTLKIAAEREDEAAAERAAATKFKHIENVHGERFEQVAAAVAEGLKAPNRLSDTYSADGKPLLSWRVHLLPRLGEDKLYRRFKLNEPWDSPSNRELVRQVPAIYSPTRGMVVGNWSPGWTHIRGFSHEGAIFEARSRYAFTDITAGPDNTLAIMDAGIPDIWTKPDAWMWEPGGPRPRLGWGSPDADTFLAATADGHVFQIKRNAPDDALRQLFDRRQDRRTVKLSSFIAGSE